MKAKQQQRDATAGMTAKVPPMRSVKAKPSAGGSPIRAEFWKDRVEIGKKKPAQVAASQLAPPVRDPSLAKRLAKTVREGIDHGSATLPDFARTEILLRATQVIGSEDAALRWMGTPVRALNYATPISMLHDESGFEAVRVVLGRLEHGVL